MNAMPAASKTLRHVIVTGAGSGLGRAFCLQLARDGWHVAVTDVNLAAAKETLALLVAQHGSGQAERLDVTDPGAWKILSEKLRADWPRLDLLVNNAGISATGEIGSMSLDKFHQVLDINFYGVLNGCQSMVPWLKETAPGGRLVNIASIFGLIAPPTTGAYNASKAAVVALSETLYGELLPLGIGVTVVAPGFFASQLLEHDRYAADVHRKIALRYMQNAQLTADEVVDQTLKAITRRRLYVVLGPKARWIWRLKRWMPSLFAKMLAWRHRRQLEKTTSGD